MDRSRDAPGGGPEWYRSEGVASIEAPEAAEAPRPPWRTRGPDAAGAAARQTAGLLTTKVARYFDCAIGLVDDGYGVSAVKSIWYAP